MQHSKSLTASCNFMLKNTIQSIAIDPQRKLNSKDQSLRVGAFSSRCVQVVLVRQSRAAIRLKI